MGKEGDMGTGKEQEKVLVQVEVQEDKLPV